VQDGGVKKKILKQAEGEPIDSNSKVTVNYVGTLPGSEGYVFDAAYKDKTFTFTLGSEEVLPGFDLAVKSMKVGEKAAFELRPEYAYGPLGHPFQPMYIPKQANLLFHIELLSASVSLQDDDPKLNETRIADAKQEKEDGNKVFANKLYAKALTCYNRGIGQLGMIKEPAPGQATEVRALLASLHLNAAAALLQLRRYKEVIVRCDKVLYYEAESTKGLCRRGQAHLALQQFVEAESDLSAALESAQEAKDKVYIAKQMRVLDAKKRKYGEQLADMCKNMF